MGLPLEDERRWSGSGGGRSWRGWCRPGTANSARRLIARRGPESRHARIRPQGDMKRLADGGVQQEELLVKGAAEHGRAWIKIVRLYFPRRTGLAAKNRYKSLTCTYKGQESSRSSAPRVPRRCLLGLNSGSSAGTSPAGNQFMPPELPQAKPEFYATAPHPHGEQYASYPAELSSLSQPDNRAYDPASEVCSPSSLLLRPAAGKDPQCLFASDYQAHATATTGAGCAADPTQLPAVNNALKTKLATIAPKEQQAVRVQPIEKCKLEEYFGPHSAGLS
ncbi:hypothetical protein GGX14DRAFT_398436 [Mycena pura]|uniref:Uncharacterized protein n=1 Tax=Mycena pura TaxID=153505 RepID=A0AAD6Y7T9_9AGAR|nr:hypothetical protein GGX14DRAFT_398436 [Mycena pura]